jgi:hypothetical protein
VQQIKGTLYVAQVPAAHVQGACGGTDVTVAKQQLHGADVETGFQSMGGQTVAQGMDPFALPVHSQLVQQAVGKQRRAILAPFPLMDADELAVALQIMHAQPYNFTDPQARSICSHEQDAVWGGESHG